MDTKNLLTLKTILEDGSFQKAAETLNYTQSTITFQIKQLEKELDIKLFEKIGRKMVLTSAGHGILPYVKTILQAEEQITNYGKDISEMTGCLRMVIPDSVLIYNLQSFIHEFMRQAPAIQLVINSLSSDDINQAIITGAADIGINCDKGNFPSSILHYPLNPFKAILVTSSHADKSLLDFITPHQSKPFSMICNEPNSNYQRSINDYLDAKDIILNPCMKMQSIEAVKRSVINNLGLSYLPVFTIRNELEKGLLVQIKTELDDKMYNSVCIYHKNKWLSPQMELAMKLLNERPDKEYV